MGQINLRISKHFNSFDANISSNARFYADTFMHEDERFCLIMNGVNLAFLVSKNGVKVNFYQDQVIAISDEVLKSFIKWETYNRKKQKFSSISLFK